MTAAPAHRVFRAVPSSREEMCHGLAGRSSGTFSAKREAMSYRQHFAHVWQTFITENFESAEHVAHVFGVDASTARNWWDGSHAPSGFAVGYAFGLAPAAAARALTGARK